MKICFVTLFVVISLIPMTNTGRCRKEWFQYNGHCYYINVNARLPFHDGWTICRSFGGNFVQLETFAENTFVKRILSQLKAPDTWMGLNDKVNEGVWQWYGTNNDATFSNWAPGQPDNLNNEDCVAFSRTDGYRWKDLSCYRILPFVCEKD